MELLLNLPSGERARLPDLALLSRWAVVPQAFSQLLASGRPVQDNEGGQKNVKMPLTYSGSWVTIF